MLLSKQASKIDVFFTKGRHSNFDIHYISQGYFGPSKTKSRNNSNIINLFRQTLREIILLFLDMALLDMASQEKNQLFRKARKMNMIIYK